MEKINYIHQINNFWRFYDLNKSKINVSDIVLYKILLRYCNKIGWVNPFTVNPFLMAEINPLSINTYYKSLKNLNDLKLINYKKGKHNVSNQAITILKINNSVNTSVETSIMTSVNTSVEVSVVNNNKTEINSKTVKQLNKEDFLFLLKSKEFKSFLKKEKLKIQKNEEKDFDFINNYNLNDNTEKFKKILIEWLDYKKERKESYKSARSVETFFKKLLKDSDNNIQAAQEITSNSIANNWAGIFPLKNNTAKPVRNSNSINQEEYKQKALDPKRNEW